LRVRNSLCAFGERNSRFGGEMGHSAGRGRSHAIGNMAPSLVGRAGEEDKIRRLPAVQRQIHNPLRVHHLAYTSAMGFNHRGGCFHKHLLCDRPDLQTRH